MESSKIKMKKIKILLSSEWSKLGTGYGNINKALGNFFIKNKDFETIELASYCFDDNLERFSSDWTVVPAGPNRSNKQLMDQYNSNFYNQFGAYRGDSVIAEWKPDVIIDFRDYWYVTHISYSPLRKYFNFLYVPTIDARPLRPEWIDQLARTDVLNSYTYFGKETIEKECGLKHSAVTPPGVEDDYFELYEKFKGTNKEVFRKKYGLPEKAFILSFVSRNQRRKLFPDVIYCIDELLRNIKEDIPIYVHFHTSYPEKPEGSWELPLYLARVSRPERFLFTYLCDKCKYVFVRTFADGICNCPNCNGSAQMPSPGTGFVDRCSLKEIMYAADVGLLVSIGEGLGMSGPEHKALGNPLLCTEFSAMEEQGYTNDGKQPRYDFQNGDMPYLGGQCVKMGYLWIEPESGQFRAYIDRQDFINKVKNWYNLSKNKEQWAKLQSEAYRCADTTYRWKKTLDTLTEQIYKLGSVQERYLEPAHILPEDQIMNNIRRLPPDKMIDYWYSIINQYMIISPSILAKVKSDIANLATYGYTTLGKSQITIRNMDEAFNFMQAHIQKINAAEQMRTNNV